MSRVLRQIQVRLESLEPQVQLGLAELDRLDRLDAMDSQGLRVLLARLDPSVIQVNRAGLESKVFRACRVLLAWVSKVVSVPREILDTRDQPERPERRDQRELPALRRPRELRDLREAPGPLVPSVTRVSKVGLESRAYRASRVLSVLARKV